MKIRSQLKAGIGVGKFCNLFVRCDDGLYCGLGICQVKKPAGAICERDQQCQTGDCVYDNQFSFDGTCG